MFDRLIKNRIEKNINRGNAIIVVGARQIGKTTLLKELPKDKKYLFLDADAPTTRSEVF